MSDALARLWPLFALRLRCADVELRLPRDGEIADLAESVARHGVHDPAEMPFLTPWTERTGLDLARGVLQWHWQRRGLWTPESWHLELAAFVGGRPVGIQGISARDFAVTRSVETGSWLLCPEQGRGRGRAMRTAVLALAFDHLGALEARSGALDGNPASAAVSRALGYREDGTKAHVVQGRRRVEQRLMLAAERWRNGRPPAVLVEGVDACLPLFGIEAPPG